MPCVDNKNLIYNIKELPETFSVSDGDLLLIETEEGTNILDYANLLIGLDNTTFGTTITQHSTDIAILSTDINTLSSGFDSLSSQVDTEIAELSASVIGSTTKALISLETNTTPLLLQNTNIESVEYVNNLIRFNFTVNLSNANYIVAPSAAVSNILGELVQFVESARGTNYIDLSAIDINSGAQATSASSIGFQLITF
ncbi:hypothetical protein N9273_00180 [bacterium]|nr:hypothetical protein [bacterium]